MIKPLLRYVRREVRNSLLRKRNVGLKILGNVDIDDCRFGRFNMLCHGVTISKSSLDDYSYVGANGRISRCKVGKYCSIGPSVTVAPGIHPTDLVSTHPIFYSAEFPCDNRYLTEPILAEHEEVELGHDVWIGNRVTILDGVTVGTGAVVGAHSLVNRDVAPYSIVVGSPAKLLRYRFDQDQIEALLRTEWWNRSEEFLRNHHDLLIQPGAIKKFLEVLSIS